MKLTVVDEFGVQDIVGHECVFSIELLEGCAHELHRFDDVSNAAECKPRPVWKDLLDIDTVSNIEGVLDEQEDASTENLLHGCSNEPRETKDKGAGRSDERG